MQIQLPARERVVPMLQRARIGHEVTNWQHLFSSHCSTVPVRQRQRWSPPQRCCQNPYECNAEKDEILDIAKRMLP